METPSSINLQPLSIPELLDRSIRLYRNNFFVFIGILAIFQIPLTIVSIVPTLSAVYATETSTQPLPNTEYLATITSCISLIFTIASFVLISGYAAAAIGYATATSYLGQPIGISDSYRMTKALVGRLLRTLIVGGIYNIGLLIWFLVPIVGWFTGMGIIFFYSAAVTPLITSMVVLENQQGGGAVRRAWDLTRRRFWPVIGFVLILSLFSQLVVTGPITLLSIFLEYLFNGPLGNNIGVSMVTARTIIQALVSLISELLFTPFYYISIILLYFDLRVRTEGLDLILTTADNESTVTKILAEASPPETSRLVTGSEMGNFVLLSVIAAILFSIFALLFGGLAPAFMSIFGQ